VLDLGCAVRRIGKLPGPADRNDAGAAFARIAAVEEDLKFLAAPSACKVAGRVERNADAASHERVAQLVGPHFASLDIVVQEGDAFKRNGEIGRHFGREIGNELLEVLAIFHKFGIEARIAQEEDREIRAGHVRTRRSDRTRCVLKACGAGMSLPPHVFTTARDYTASGYSPDAAGSSETVVLIACSVDVEPLTIRLAYKSGK